MERNALVRPRWLGVALAIGVIGLAAPLPCAAQPGLEVDTLRQGLRIPQPATFAVAAKGGWTAPAMTIGVPSGYGASWGDAFLGAGFQARTRFADRPDGGVVAGFGIGDPRRLLGLEVAVSSYGTARSCCRGGVSGKLHRILPGEISVALGVENGLDWGSMEGERAASDAGTSVYVAASHVMGLRSDPGSFLGSAALTLGAGNGRFRRESDILTDRDRVNLFASAGVRVARPLSAVASWTGQDLVAGVSLVPLHNVPLYITPAFADLTTSPRFILGIGYGFNFSSLF
jgi:hypothetical protein